MLVVVSKDIFIQGEAEIINALFEKGLGIFHLRKPESTIREVDRLLRNIKPKFHQQIALHHWHELGSKYGINRFHFPSAQRLWLSDKKVEMQQEGIYSTSIHEVEELETLNSLFSYVFLSPVFDSISKPGYLAKDHDLTLIEREEGSHIIGLGGIEEKNLKKVREKGYDGIALCGAIWIAEKPVKAFLNIQNKWNTIVP